MSLTQQAQQIIDVDVIENFKNNLKSRDRWCTIFRTLDVFSHCFSASSIICAFLGGVIAHPTLPIIAGCCGCIMLISNSYSAYAKKEYQSQCEIIEEYSKKLNVVDDLVDESPEMLPVSTPAQTPATQTNQ